MRHLRVYKLIVAALIVLITIGGAGQTVMATTDPGAGVSHEPQNPYYSERCQWAFNTYYLEAEWFMNHPGIDVDDPRFNVHYSRLFDSWYIAELACGVDIDGTGHLGY